MTRVLRGSRYGLACLPFVLLPCLLLPSAFLACGGSHPGQTMNGGTGSAGTSGTGAGGQSGPDGGAGAGGADGGSAEHPIGPPSKIKLDGSPIYTRVQRLTNAQLTRAAADVLRLASPDSLKPTFTTPVADAPADFDNNEKRLVVDQQAALELEAAAEKAAALATGSDDALARLYSGTDAEGFVRALGRRAFRRPLTPDEETKYQGVFALGQKLYSADFASGASLVIRAMLQSPSFLYRSELGPADEALDGYEVASKLSFWLLGTTPSDDLLDAAAGGQLDSADGLEKAARRMLEDPAALEIMRDFHGQLYHLDWYQAVARQDVFEAMRGEAAKASDRFFDSVVTSGEGLRAILTSSRYFVGTYLAASYQTPEVDGDDVEQRVLDASRIGYFMQVPFLMLNGREDGPDSIARGVALLGDVLCDAPDGHNGSSPAIPPLAAGHTNRQRIEALTAACGDCHGTRIDPLGFAFEDFDGLGRRRAFDNELPVVAGGSYPFEDGTRSFASGIELLRILADSVQAHTCYAKKLTGYALGRDIAEDDRPLLDDLAKVSWDRSLKEMVVSLVRSPSFRLRAEGTP